MDIIRFSLSASLFVLVVVMLRMTVSFRLPKITFRVLWAAVLVALLIPISIPSNFSIHNVFIQNAEIIESESCAINVDSNEVIVSSETPPTLQNDTALPECGLVECETNIAPSVDCEVATNPQTIREKISLLDYIHFFLITGSIVLFATAFIPHFKHRRVYATSLPCHKEIISNWVESHKLLRKYSVRVLDTISSPLSYGLFKPVILLPSNLDFSNKEQINCILYHEYIHIKRFDVVWKFLFFIALSVHWFNPLIWIAFILMNRDIEISCDEEVVKYIGGSKKSKYAEMLIELTQKRRAPFLLLNAFSTSVTKERVRSIMKFKKTTLVGVIISVSLVVFTVAIFATSANETTAQGELPNNTLVGTEVSEQSDANDEANITSQITSSSVATSVLPPTPTTVSSTTPTESIVTNAPPTTSAPVPVITQERTVSSIPATEIYDSLNPESNIGGCRIGTSCSNCGKKKGIASCRMLNCEWCSNPCNC